jgi:hypothetical protein
LFLAVKSVHSQTTLHTSLLSFFRLYIIQIWNFWIEWCYSIHMVHQKSTTASTIIFSIRMYTMPMSVNTNLYFLYQPSRHNIKHYGAPGCCNFLNSLLKLTGRGVFNISYSFESSDYHREFYTMEHPNNTSSFFLLILFMHYSKVD